ncbi:hypothetical protein C2L66_18405 [Paraburkholderia caribensis]|nr:hypothetical protein C2L66_18405 [Paraburkholderia caribensis]
MLCDYGRAIVKLQRQNYQSLAIFLPRTSLVASGTDAQASVNSSRGVIETGRTQNLLQPDMLFQRAR